MATKTFKIGLSATDKQNMAQDIYELVVNMCFNEYDSSNTYNQGDFVVYENPTNTFKLYKCIANNVTGAWDNTKWELAKLQDILDDIENAVQYVNDKANVDGNYPTMTVGVADQLSPYDEDSGDDQDEPFNFQATGTANGTQSDFSTGSIALMKEKQGNTIVVNQLVDPTELPETQTVNGITLTNNNDGTLTFSGVATANVAIFTPNLYLFSNKGGHKALIIGATDKVKIYDGYSGSNITNIGIIDVNENANVLYFLILNNTDLSTPQTIKPQVIDLTQMFNGNIPADLLSHPENFFRYYQGSLAYNAGTLVNANAQYIKCIGRNQWDEEWEVISSRVWSKNYIKVVPNVYYNFYCAVLNLYREVYLYDENKNLIDVIGLQQHGIFHTPSNCLYIKIAMYTTYGTTYNHDITISLYYEDESGYDQYYPYEVLTNNDTGTETLRSAGSVRDSKLPSGEIIRRIGSVDLGSLSWNQVATGIWNTAGIKNLMKKPATALVLGNAICNKYTNRIASGFLNSNVGEFTLTPEGDLNINNGDTTNSPTGTLFYELATPTTEQGTSFSENLLIDDFGSMDYQGTNGVPQGNLIFYPVDYKAFIDTLYNYTEGTPSNIALKSDLASDKSELQGVDTQLLNAIGGTLRQCLCVKETLDFDDTDFIDLGELSWGNAVNQNVFYADVSNRKAYSLKMLCSKYKTATSVTNADGDNINNEEISSGQNTYVYIKTTAYTDATAFKNAMKGVLLAYEKA